MAKIIIHKLIGGLLVLIPHITIIMIGFAMHTNERFSYNDIEPSNLQEYITLFLCGDVMTGRGIDQILKHPSDPVIHEVYMKDARGYLRIAEQANGEIFYPVDDKYIWGYALKVFEHIHPDVKIINLETSITKSDAFWMNKGINYRMHPKNVGCLTSAEIDFCSLANNHVLDWGYSGLTETIETLQQAGISYSGAGRDISEASRPAMINVDGKGKVVVLSYGLRSSGIPLAWAASPENAGVNMLTILSDDEVGQIKRQIDNLANPKDIVVFSIHWGGNWGYEIPKEHISFAHQLIDEAGVDIIYGHSSHHFKGIEVYKNKLILYGCGDFINDYEGISGHESFRDDLVLMYYVDFDPEEETLASLQLFPAQLKNFRINKAEQKDMIWIMDVLNREGQKFNTSVELNKDLSLSLHWY